MNWYTIFIIFLSLWFLVGFVSITCVFLIEMRGHKYDADFFDAYTKERYITGICMGFFVPLIILYDEIKQILEQKKLFTRLLYKIANIGIKNRS